MSKVTIAKLAILIILAFFVCLPEFFSSDVLQVQFLCAPFDPCNPNGGRGYYDEQVYDNAGIARPRCEAQIAVNQDEAEEQWFVCETYADLRSIRDNASISEKDLKVIIMLQITTPLLQNMTVNGHVNHSGIYVETQYDIILFGCCIQNESTQQNKENMSQSSSSTPDIFPTSSSEGLNRNSSDHTHRKNITVCLNRFKNIRGMISTTVKWWRVSVIVWLVLVLLVVVLVLLGVRDQVFKNKHFKKRVKPVRPPAIQPKTFSKRRVKSLGDLPDNISALSEEDIELFLEKTPSNYSRDNVTTQRRVSLASTKRLLHIFQESYKRGLSPIPELSLTDVSLGEEARSDCVMGVTEEDHNVCLDIPLTQATAHTEHLNFLHHRIHSSLESCH